MATRLFLSINSKAPELEPQRARSNGPAAPENIRAFRETTFSAQRVSAIRRPPRSRGRASGDCRKDLRRVGIFGNDDAHPPSVGLPSKAEGQRVRLTASRVGLEDGLRQFAKSVMWLTTARW